MGQGYQRAFGSCARSCQLAGHKAFEAKVSFIGQAKTRDHLTSVDLDALSSSPPYLVGSVQKLYLLEDGGQSYFISEATDAGSVFDVGSLFSIPNSGRFRSELRHAIYVALSSPKAWSELQKTTPTSPLVAHSLEKYAGSKLLQKLTRTGARTHHIGMIDKTSGEVITGPLDQSQTASSSCLVEAFRVIKPRHISIRTHPLWDYHEYHVAPSKVIALEHIFRLGSPQGAAIVHRYRDALEQGAESAKAFLDGLGLTQPIVPWKLFETILYDASTKYEDHDRYLDYQEMLHLSGVGHDQFDEVISLLELSTVFVQSIFARLGFVLWDIKWEAAVDGGEIVVVDTVDHDSLRITSDVTTDGRRCYTHFNKQAVRDYYRILEKDWIAALDDAKKAAEVDPSAATFRAIYDEGVQVGRYPPIPSLDPTFAALMSSKYDIVAGSTSGRINETQCAGRIAQIVEDERDYYQSRNSLDEFLAHVSS